MRFFFIFSLLFLYFCNIQSQTIIDELDICQFTIVENKDTINFIKVDKNITKAKPTIIFCQGSMPMPLIIRDAIGDLSITALSNFDYSKIAEKYNFVIISMPSIPIIVDEENLNHNYAYITDKRHRYSYPQNYLDNNILDRHVERVNSVVNFIVQQQWTTNKIFIIGHSQGSRVAAKVAIQNKYISALGYLSGNPFGGRIEEAIHKIRHQAIKKEISASKAQEEKEKIYDWWQWLNDHANEKSKDGSDSPQTTISFSIPTVDELVNCEIPIYVAYGTEDISASYCDLLPIELIKAGKKNYKLVPYIGLEHNFMEIDENGKRDPQKCHWGKVISDFITWIEEY